MVSKYDCHSLSDGFDSLNENCNPQSFEVAIVSSRILQLDMCRKVKVAIWKKYNCSTLKPSLAVNSVILFEILKGHSKNVKYNFASFESP